MAHAVGGRLHLAQVDAEIARALAHGGRGEGLGLSPTRSAERSRGALLGRLAAALRQAQDERAWAPPRTLGRRADVGIASSIASVATTDAIAERLLVPALDRAGIALGLDLDQHAADREHVADLAGQLGDRPRDGRFHFDRCLVGHHVGELLVFLDAVADLDVPCDDFGLGNAFANVGQLELIDGH